MKNGGGALKLLESELFCSNCWMIDLGADLALHITGDIGDAAGFGTALIEAAAVSAFRRAIRDDMGAGWEAFDPSWCYLSYTKKDVETPLALCPNTKVHLSEIPNLSRQFSRKSKTTNHDVSPAHLP